MKKYDNILQVQHDNPALWHEWRWQLENSIYSVEQLRSLLPVDICRNPKESVSRKVTDRYPMRITPYYLSVALQGNDRADAVLKQCMPDIAEIKHTDLPEDPFSETEHMPVPGIIHRYKDRLVLLVSDICAMNCRHCTRKNILGDSIALYDDIQLERAFAYIRQQPAVREVLVSGGDPLMLETSRLDYVLRGLQAIEHVDVIRIGTRIPVVLPMRIDDELCDMLAKYRPLWINTQFNHPAELTDEAITACDKLIRTGIPVSNQAVLMKGVNDNIDVMRKLCCSLQSNLIRPYYVFQCDPVRGVEYLMTDIALGMEMEEQLRQSIGGLALPRFVADMPGTAGKVPLKDIVKDEK